MKLLKKLYDLVLEHIYYAQFTGCDAAMSGNLEMAEVEQRARLWIGIYDFLHILPSVIICHFTQHKWEVTSCINGESGSEFFFCHRCGESHDITYY
jgi:hypothetical protein